MAFKLSKQDSQRLDNYAIKLDAGKLELETALQAAVALIAPAVEAFNETLREAQAFCEDIQNEAQGQFDDKSERWQESERGEEISEWIEQLLPELTEYEAPEFELSLSDDPGEIIREILQEPEY